MDSSPPIVLLFVASFSTGHCQSYEDIAPLFGYESTLVLKNQSRFKCCCREGIRACVIKPLPEKRRRTRYGMHTHGCGHMQGRIGWHSYLENRRMCLVSTQIAAELRAAQDSVGKMQRVEKAGTPQVLQLGTVGEDKHLKAQNYSARSVDVCHFDDIANVHHTYGGVTFRDLLVDPMAEHIPSPTWQPQIRARLVKLLQNFKKVVAQQPASVDSNIKPLKNQALWLHLDFLKLILLLPLMLIPSILCFLVPLKYRNVHRLFAWVYNECEVGDLLGLKAKIDESPKEYADRVRDSMEQNIDVKIVNWNSGTPNDSCLTAKQESAMSDVPLQKKVSFSEACELIEVDYMSWQFDLDTWSFHEDYLVKQVQSGKLQPAIPVSAIHVTTVRCKSIPRNYTRELFLELLDSWGFFGLYDFVYLPLAFKTGALESKKCSNLGYAFVNFDSVDTARAFELRFDGFRDWGDSFTSTKAGAVYPADIEGKQAHIERYRNSPMMHSEAPDEHKPVLFEDGKRIPFPEPSKMLKHPWIQKRVQISNLHNANLPLA